LLNRLRSSSKNPNNVVTTFRLPGEKGLTVIRISANMGYIEKEVIVKLLNKEEVIQIMKDRQNGMTQETYATKVLRVRPSYLSDIYNGYRTPGPTILKKLGLRKVVLYAEKKSE